MINVLIVDDHQLFAEGIKNILVASNEITIINVFHNGKMLLEFLESNDEKADVILLDLQMPDFDGVDTFKLIDTNENKIIILSTFFNPGIVTKMLKQGASSYIAKNEHPSELITAIKEVHNKGYYLNSSLISILNQNIEVKLNQNEPELSNREKEILIHICQGLTNAEVGKKLFISKRTVDGHRARILDKLTCKNTIELVMYAIRNNIMSVTPKKFS